MNFVQNFPFLSQFSGNFPPLSGGKFGRIYSPEVKFTCPLFKQMKLSTEEKVRNFNSLVLDTQLDMKHQLTWKTLKVQSKKIALLLQQLVSKYKRMTQ